MFGRKERSQNNSGKIRINRFKTNYSEMFDSHLSAAQKHEWIKKVTVTAAEKQWNETLASLDELFESDILYYPTQQKDLLESLRVTHTEWMRIDRNLLTDEEASKLYDALHTSLPAFIYLIGLLKAARTTTDRNHEDDFLAVQKIVSDIQSDVLGVRAKVDAQKLARYRELHPSNPEHRLQSLEWPDYSALEDDLRNRITKIRQLWENQVGKMHNTKDEYLLERIVTDYLPSSLNLFNLFSSDQSIMKGEASKALHKQLDIIENHLKQMASTHFDEQMMMMQAQTEFLEERLKDD